MENLPDCWVTDRDPTNDELKVIFKKGDYEVLGELFLVTDGYQQQIRLFERPPHPNNGWYHGFWDYDDIDEILAWTKLPLLTEKQLEYLRSLKHNNQ